VVDVKITTRRQNQAMSERTTLQRAIRGAMEGAATGLAVASVRAGVKLYRDGAPDLGTHFPEIVAYFATTIICTGYIFAIGRMIADGIAGSLLGAAIIALSGILAGSLVAYDSTEIPYPIIVGGACGALVGAPLGASIHRYIAKPRNSE
jgi:hypothetical protein